MEERTANTSGSTRSWPTNQRQQMCMAHPSPATGREIRPEAQVQQRTRRTRPFAIDFAADQGHTGALAMANAFPRRAPLDVADDPRQRGRHLTEHERLGSRKSDIREIGRISAPGSGRSGVRLHGTQAAWRPRAMGYCLRRSSTRVCGHRAERPGQRPQTSQSRAPGVASAASF